MAKNSIHINYTDNKIEVSKAFIAKAEIFGSDEYKALKAAREAEPTFTFEIIKSKKKTYKKLTFEKMEQHINYMEQDEEKKAAVLKEFEELKKGAKAGDASVYPIVKKWFLDRYKKSYLCDNITEEENNVTEEDAA